MCVNSDLLFWLAVEQSDICRPYIKIGFYFYDDYVFQIRWEIRKFYSHFTISRSSRRILVSILYLLASRVAAILPGTLKIVIANLNQYFKQFTKNITYVIGFRMVPLLLLMLHMINKSLNRKSPLSLRAPWPVGIVTSSKCKKDRSFVTNSLTPSSTI